MNETFDYLFQYLEKEHIPIDKNEFEFQIQSHPDYPSLLSIADTLSFFTIENGAIRVAFSELELLPSRFVTLLKEENGEPKLCFIEKKGHTFYYSKDKKSTIISRESLEQRWNNIVLLVEKSELENAVVPKKYFWIMPSLCLGLFIATIIVFQESWQNNLFFIFPLLGMLFSVAALKDLFGTNSEVLNKFCNISSSTSCTTVVGSNKWKVFKYLNFSDLSIVFFSSQFLGLFLFILYGEPSVFLSLQKLLLIFSIPVLVISLYFQKFVEKKWCPICLVIITVILSEILFLVLFQENNFNLSVKSLLIFGFSFVFIVLIWLLLKGILTHLKELKEFQLKGNRFIRNYQNFKNTLLTKTKIELPDSPFILGNKESQTEIAIITNPFCGHCKNVHELIDKIVEKHRNDLKIRIIFKTDIDNDSEDSKTIFRNLLQVYLEKGEKSFGEALKYWFLTKNSQEFNKVYASKADITKADAVFRIKNDWCLKNAFSYTPAIFINGHEYPNSYERESLEFFINDLIEDTF